MISRKPLLIGVAVLLLAPSLPARGQHHEHPGTVNFPISCNEEARQDFDRGLALLHHMMYEQAEAQFASAAARDPGCAMAHWGIGMTHIHPLWGEPPSEGAMQKGRAAVAKAAALKAPTPREQDFLTALAAFYEGADTAYPARLSAWEAALARVHETYPDDVDAGAFYALAHLATAPKADKTFAHQQKAGALLEALHAKAPEHPGLFHYTIHAYDNPALADRAVDVARGYDKLAPEVPHALHMPSHIFVRLGLWPDVIGWNTRSAAAARKHPVNGATSMHYFHALDYLVYGYLQQGQDEKAREVVDRLQAVETHQPGLASAYALAAIPARYSLERARWEEAAALPVRPQSGFPWDKLPAAESITYFARGLGAARSGDAAAARQAIEALDRLHQQLTEAGEPYWAVLTDAQRKTIAAWQAFAEGNKEEARKRMEEAASLEDSVDKHPVTPGAVLPARELLGEMLLLLDQPEDALAAYEASLRVSPNRFNSLLGAGRAAALAGKTDLAHTYYHDLVALAGQADAERAGLAEARAYLAKEQ